MKLATTTREAARLLRACDPRWVYDYDAPRLTIEDRLNRFRLALEMARRRCTDPLDQAEISYALQDCAALIALQPRGEEVIRRERVVQRLARIRRVVTYHEGQAERLNRRFWWVPFFLILSLMLARIGPELISLFI